MSPSNSVYRRISKLKTFREARIVDDDFIDVADGVDGELLVRGPSVFRLVDKYGFTHDPRLIHDRRYVNDPDATAEAFHEGWMRTGDVLHIDSEGFLYLTDRTKELIKYKGFQVAPSELEGILTSHPYVDEGVVCPKWDEENGTEIPMAYITLTRDAPVAPRDLSEAIRDIQKFVDGKVSPYKRLRGGIEILQEIPKTASGKILRRVLRARSRDIRTSKL